MPVRAVAFLRSRRTAAGEAVILIVVSEPGYGVEFDLAAAARSNQDNWKHPLNSEVTDAGHRGEIEIMSGIGTMHVGEKKFVRSVPS